MATGRVRDSRVGQPACVAGVRGGWELRRIEPVPCPVGSGPLTGRPASPHAHAAAQVGPIVVRASVRVRGKAADAAARVPVRIAVLRPDHAAVTATRPADASPARRRAGRGSIRVALLPDATECRQDDQRSDCRAESEFPRTDHESLMKEPEPGSVARAARGGLTGSTPARAGSCRRRPSCAPPGRSP